MTKNWCVPILAVAVAGVGESGAWADPRVDAFQKLVTTSHSGGGLSGLKTQRRAGMLTFTTPITHADGFGDGAFDGDTANRKPEGHRPTLQGNGTVLRVNGLDAQSCNECHTIVKNRTLPPTLGIGGVGGIVQDAIILPTMMDVADSQDDRMGHQPGHDPDLAMVFDGVADFNGRLANPPFLFGGGGVEMLGKEMTVDLQALLQRAREAPAGTVTQLETHGVDFGYLTSLAGGGVELHVEGIGPKDPTGVAPEDVLVVRPFGRKGENFSMRDFDRGAMQFHFGMQPVEVVGAGSDPDGDGISDEVTVEEMTNLHIFDVTNPPPVLGHVDHEAARGFLRFNEIGCASCHRPVLTTRSRSLPLAHPEVPTDPNQNVYRRIDLRDVGFPSYGRGVAVPLFSDLKRHDMGPRLEESFEGAEIPNPHFITARLWGIADTAPYLHDGRATTLFQAIEFHGGEAQGARDAFLALSERNQERLLKFLGALRTPNRPNEELVE